MKDYWKSGKCSTGADERACFKERNAELASSVHWKEFFLSN
jgi:hypothetical protein